MLSARLRSWVLPCRRLSKSKPAAARLPDPPSLMPFNQLVGAEEPSRLLSLSSVKSTVIQLTETERSVFDLFRRVIASEMLDISLTVTGGWARKKFAGETNSTSIAKPTPIELEVKKMKPTYFLTLVKQWLRFKRLPNLFILPADELFVSARWNGIQINIRKQQLRPDITVNSIAYDVVTGTLHELSPAFCQDWDGKMIRTVVSATSHCRKDPIRILRLLSSAVRLDFRLSPDIILAGYDQTIRRELGKTSRDRVACEFFNLAPLPHFNKFVTYLYLMNMFSIIFPLKENVFIDSKSEVTSEELKSGIFIEKLSVSAIEFETKCLGLAAVGHMTMLEILLQSRDRQVAPFVSLHGLEGLHQCINNIIGKEVSFATTRSALIFYPLSYYQSPKLGLDGKWKMASSTSMMYQKYLRFGRISDIESVIDDSKKMTAILKMIALRLSGSPTASVLEEEYTNSLRTMVYGSAAVEEHFPRFKMSCAKKVCGIPVSVLMSLHLEDLHFAECLMVGMAQLLMKALVDPQLSSDLAWFKSKDPRLASIMQSLLKIAGLDDEISALNDLPKGNQLNYMLSKRLQGIHYQNDPNPEAILKESDTIVKHILLAADLLWKETRTLRVPTPYYKGDEIVIIFNIANNMNHCKKIVSAQRLWQLSFPHATKEETLEYLRKLFPSAS